MNGTSDVGDLFARCVRQIILEQSRRANVGHIGSALSIADLIAVLYDRILKIRSASDPDRDRFILSKGHAALALYAALHLKGLLDKRTLDTYCGDDSLLGVHPEHALPGVDFCSGSLGQGFSFAVGTALAARIQGSKRRVFVLLSDAECNEGVVWEAVQFAAQHRLSNLCALIDLNGQQAIGYTKDILDLSPMAEKWRAFRWEAFEADGHDQAAIFRLLSGMNFAEGTPRVVVARTVFGKGVSFMENQIPWHYLPMNKEQYARACAEIGTAEGT